MKRIAYLFLTVLLLGGCTLPVHTRELEQLQVIQTLGCDGAPGAVTVSVSSGPDPSGEAPLRLAAEGRSLTKALETLQDASPREELFFAHTRFAVIGEAAARAGLAPLLDHFERSTQTPLTVPLFVVRGGEARQLLTGSEDPAYEATALLASLQRGATHCPTLLEIARDLALHGAALSAAVELLPAQESAASAEEGALMLRPAGYAVWKDGALRGYLSPEAAFGLDVLRSRTPRPALVLSTPEGLVTVEMRSCRTRFDAASEDGRVLVRCRAGLREAEGLARLDDDTLRALDAALSAEVRARVESALRSCREMGADALALGPSFFSTDWRAEVSAGIERSYDINESGVSS